MTDQTVPELTGYQATAAELRRIADAIEHLELGREVPYVNVSFMPSVYQAPPEQRIADVDAVAYALFGRDGQRETHKDGSQYHLIRVTRAGVNITVQEQISAPDDEPEAGR
jgi:hypothetical protein